MCSHPGRCNDRNADENTEREKASDTGLRFLRDYLCRCWRRIGLQVLMAKQQQKQTIVPSHGENYAIRLTNAKHEPL